MGTKRRSREVLLPLTNPRGRIPYGKCSRTVGSLWFCTTREQRRRTATRPMYFSFSSGAVQTKDGISKVESHRSLSSGLAFSDSVFLISGAFRIDTNRDQKENKAQATVGR